MTAAWLVEDIDALRVHLAAGREFHEVVADDGAPPAWTRTAPAERRFGGPVGLPQEGLKDRFFAARENLFVFDGEVFRETLPGVAPRVFFGVAACDAGALAVHDRFFAADPYYRARRDTALIVGIDCVTPCTGGFCEVVDAGPFVRPRGVDLILHPRADGRWLLLAPDERGERAVSGLRLPVADAALPARRRARETEVVAAFEDRAWMRPAIARIDANAVERTLWESMALQCLACSGCVSLCPTCSCYATRDLPEADGGVLRERFWDACLYEGFQREASGHHPAATPGTRLHRYWTHKFARAFTDELGRIGCVGCGRCDRVCPGVIGAGDVLRRIANG